MTAPVITVDGPSGSGKGTVSQILARRLGWHLLDSGALYRVVAIMANRAGFGPGDPNQVRKAADLARVMPVEFSSDREGPVTVKLAGEDVTSELRAEATGDSASRYAQLPAIRGALLDRQRAFRQPPGLVADGRDMGTVVFPEASLKAFVTASVGERARRRVLQLKQMGMDANIDKIFSEIAARDARDAERAHSPLKPADDAIQVDTTSLSIDDVVDRLLALARERGLVK